MPSTYSSLKIELIATGEQSGTWGNTTNTNLGTAIEEAITGSADVVFSSADVTVTLTDTNAAQAARNLRLNLTGTSGGARNLILGSGCQIEKLYLVNNGLADAVTVKNTTGTGITVPAGKSMFVYNNGTNVVDAITYLSAIGTGVFDAGTVSAPSITFTGDTNTGIYSPAADTIAFTEGGVESVRIDSSGNVGIGTSGPSTGVQLQRASGNTYYRAQNNLANADFGVDSAGIGILWNNSNYPLAFGTNNSERMRIDSSGNVGIGTSSPYQAKLDVKGVGGTGGVANIGASNSNDDQLLIGSINRGSSPAFFSLPTGSAFVGALGNGVANTLGVGTYGSAPVIFATNNTERLRIDSSGRVGIGASSLASGLSLNTYGTAWTGNTVNTYPVPAGNVFLTMQTVPSAANWFGTTGTYGATSGSSNLLLQVNLNNTSQQAGNYIGSEAASATSANLTFGAMISGSTTGGNSTKSEFMRIDSSGNVGIGTNNPTYKLQVEGGTGTNAGLLDLSGTATSSILFFTNATNGAFNNLTVAGDPLIIGIQNQSLLVGVHDGSAIRFGDTDMRFGINSNERMRLDSSGNLGIGVTPSAWGSGASYILEQPNGTALGNFANLSQTILTANCFFNSSGQWIYKNTAGASYYTMNSGNHYWFTAGSGTAGTAINFTQEKMVLLSNGNVGIGTNSPTNYGAGTTTLSISNATNSGYLDIYNAGLRRGYHFATSSTYNISTTTSTALVLETAGSERMRIDAAGIVLINTTSTGNVNGGPPKLAVNGGVSVTAGVTQTALFEQGIITNDSGGNNNYWQYLGRFSANQGGAVCAIRYYYHIGFNANNGQNGIIDIFFKTANGTSFQAGSTGNFYGDGQYFKLGPQSVNAVRVVQQSNITDYDIYVQIGNFSNQSFYTVATSGGTYWTDVGTGSTSAPTGNFITLTANSITYT